MDSMSLSTSMRHDCVDFTPNSGRGCGQELASTLFISATCDSARNSAIPLKDPSQ